MEKITEAMIEGMALENDDDAKDLIKRYHTAFFEKAPEITELALALRRIEEGEKRRILRAEREKERLEKNKERKIKSELFQRRKREAAMKREERQKLNAQRAAEQAETFKLVLNERINKWKSLSGNGYKELQIPDARGMDVGFNKELDRFLFITTHQIGYGKWDEIYAKVVNHPYFQFNFLLRTLKPLQFKQRMDTILRACSKTSKKRSSPGSSLDVTTQEFKIGDGEKTDDDQPPNKRQKLSQDVQMNEQPSI